MSRGHHHRNSETEEQEHVRWYDSSRAQVLLAVALITLPTTVAGAGYALHDVVDKPTINQQRLDELEAFTRVRWAGELAS